MRLLRFIPFLVPLAVFGTTAEDVLSKLDQSAAKFSAMTANITKLSYTKVIDDKSTEEGSIALRKLAARDLQVLIDFKKPDPKTVALHGRKAEIYYPKLKLVQEFDLGKRTDLMDQFLLVGFGTTGQELKANYSIKYGGEEAISGQKAGKLEFSQPSLRAVRNCKSWSFGSITTSIIRYSRNSFSPPGLLPVHLQGRKGEPPIGG